MGTRDQRPVPGFPFHRGPAKQQLSGQSRRVWPWRGALSPVLRRCSLADVVNEAQTSVIEVDRYMAVHPSAHIHTSAIRKPWNKLHVYMPSYAKAAICRAVSFPPARAPPSPPPPPPPKSCCTI